MLSEHKFHNFTRREKSLCSTAIKRYLHVNGLEQLNFLILSTMAKSIRSGTEHLIPDEISHVGLGVVLKHGLSTRFNIFILGKLRKFKINNKACTSFKIEKTKIAFDNTPPPGWPVTANSPPWGGQSCKLLDKCPGGGGGVARAWNWQSHNYR